VPDSRGAAPARPLHVRAPRALRAQRGPGFLATAKKRLGVWYSSLTFHVCLLALLGFFTVAQETGVYERLFDPSAAAPPVHTVRLRGAERTRVDLDRAERAVRPIDLWNTPGDGPGGIEREGATPSDHDESADG